ncbi:lipopolysaccharide biosynthesis protein [Rhizobium sp. P32RR-XVIII]|uniref:lipopolysaccharide biosynthesis protein n=1 Tax=Rhizobium sp. P32RR-XVIII TaxID=2726738 RepID=UPI001FF04CF7|nr:lipopolysaccharide biosynthesis protein [Rhizobium sp. P32RR-XVIII]
MHGGHRAQMARFLQGWNDEARFAQRLRNIGHLLAGNFASSFIGLIGFALTARALGPSQYGILALSFAYARGIERLLAFRSWQPLIKYGAEVLHDEDRDALRALFKFGLLLDMGTALLAWAIAVLLVLVAGPKIGISQDTSRYVIMFCTVLPFQMTGMSVAALRLFDRYQVLAYAQVVGTCIRVLLCGLGLAAGWGLTEFLMLWAGTQILGSLNMTILAFIELRARGIHKVMSAPLRGITTRFPGLFRFSVSSNLSSSIRSSASELDTLLVGFLTDPASAGLYHIAKRIGRIAQQVGAQVQAVLFPDLARAWASKDLAAFRKMIAQAQLLLICFGVIALIIIAAAINKVLELTAGPEFVAAGPLVMVQMVAVVFILNATVLYSALLAMSLERSALRSIFIAIAFFHLTLILLVPRLGPMGANIAHIVMACIWVTGMMAAYRQRLRAPS